LGYVNTVGPHATTPVSLSKLTVYRCNQYKQAYSLYSRTVFEQRRLTPQQVVLLLCGILKGEPSKALAAEAAFTAHRVCSSFTGSEFVKYITIFDASSLCHL
jgi:hypothetical protein